MALLPISTTPLTVRTTNYLPRIRFAFASILARADELSLPRLTICVARALAFAACERSGIGYLREPGKPKVDFDSLLRRFEVSLPLDAIALVAALNPRCGCIFSSSSSQVAQVALASVSVKV